MLTRCSSLFFFFYFNRLFATIVSYAIRAYTWHYYRADVDIQALQFSLLGGRIIFKGIRYHGVNETIFVQGGYVTWNYWKRAVRTVDLDAIARKHARRGSCAEEKVEGLAGETGGVRGENRLPCRIVATIFGLEWFVYNRTPAYDDILSGFASAAPESVCPSPTEATSTGRQSARSNLSARFGRTSTEQSGRRDSAGRASSSVRTSDVSAKQTKESSIDSAALDGAMRLLQFLPIQVDCTKGAFVAGNENTRSVLTITFQKASGMIDAAEASNPLDLYRQIFTFDLTRPVIQLRPNPDFKQPQLTAARELASTPDDDPQQKKKKFDYTFDYYRHKKAIWHSIKDLIPYFQTSVESFHLSSSAKSPNPASATSRFPENARWVGLSRYLDDETTDDHEAWTTIEYARYSTLLDCPSLSLTYYWDIAGKVPVDYPDPSSSVRQASQDINGDSPPEWGVDLKIERGFINYGPWADRERVVLQNVFFPNNFRDARPAEPLKPGTYRRSTKLKIRAEITGDTSLRIPIREGSKDWQWKGRADAVCGASRLYKEKQKQRSRNNQDSDKSKMSPEIRPFGWLTLSVSQDSTITYDMDMVASNSGYTNRLLLDLRDCKLSSSVNHGILWQSPRQVVDCDLSNPVGWNSLHTWTFTVTSSDLQMFLLRDHIFLFTDLVSDWTSGSTADYYTFVPFIYKFRLLFNDVRLYLNVNDSNIINNPSDLNDNTFVVIKGKRLASDVTVPADTFKADQSTFSFGIDLDDGGIEVLTPLWHTLHTFLQDNSLGSLEHLSIDGSYTIHAETSPALTDKLAMNISSSSVRCYLYGFLIRYCLKIRENYFAEDMHFRTLEEFQTAANSQDASTLHGAKNPNAKSNDLDVSVNIAIDGPCALLPVNLYDHSKSLRLTAATLDIDVRFTNYYMDLQFSLSPTRVSLETLGADGTRTNTDPQLFIDGVSVHGHRLFGLPPAEPTYVCNWDFDLGRIVGECVPSFISHAGAALQNLDFTMDDEENVLPPLVPIVVHDVVFLRAKVESVDVALLVDQSALIVRVGQIDVQFNDWSRSQFSKRMSMKIPTLIVAAVDRKSATRSQTKPSEPVATHALFETSLRLLMVQRNAHLLEHRNLQQQHIKIHDQRTHRTPWLLLNAEESVSKWPETSGRIHPPAMTVPPMPDPITDEFAFESSSSIRSRLRTRLKHKSSFLSNTGSSISGSRIGSDQNSGRHAASLLNYGGTSLHRMVASQRPDQSRSSSDGPLSFKFQPSMFWMPSFNYHNLRPDPTHLPPLPEVRSAPGVNNETFIEASEDEDTTHTGIFVEFTPGLRGFFTPDFLFALASLVDGMQPSDPVVILDSLQKDVLSDLVKSDKAKKVAPKSTVDFSVRVPAAIFRLLNWSEASGDGFQGKVRDEYNVSCTRLKATMRTLSERGNCKKSMTTHVTADMLSLSALGGQSDALQDEAELQCILAEPVFWSSERPWPQAHVRLRSLKTVTSTRSVEPLAFLVERTTTMFSSVASSFQRSVSGAERVRYLVWSLTEGAAAIPDPLFLTRPSYILRLSQSHLRQHDSWKIIARLRNMYKSLSVEDRDALQKRGIKTGYAYPKEAQDIVIQNFDEWRPWDLSRVDKSHVMQVIWGDRIRRPDDGDHHKSENFSCVVKEAGLVIDPGPRQSNVHFGNLSMAVSIDSKSVESQGERSVTEKLVTARLHCSSATLRLQWEILEIVEGVARTVSRTSSQPTTIAPAPEAKADMLTDFHIIVGIDEGTATLNAINLRFLVSGYGVSCSFVYNGQREEQPEQMSFIITGKGCSTTLSSRLKPLMIWEFWQPTLYGSCGLSQSSAGATYDWKVASSCQNLIYDMREDPIGLVHAADRVVEDEVRYVLDLVRRLSDTPSSRRPSSVTEKSAKRAGVHHFQVALFLNEYRMKYRLLPSLLYVIDGRVARMSVATPTDGKVEVDFDVKSNRHDFQSMEGEEPQPVSNIDLPPVNGRVLGMLSSSTVSIHSDVTVELARLEASSLRSILSIVSRPEISHFMSDLKGSFQDLQHHFTEIVDKKAPITSSSENVKARDLLYNVRLTMAGIGIHARAPGLRSQDYQADMDFTLGSTQMRLDNTSDTESPLGHPEFHINVSRIALELRKRERSRSRPYGGLAVDIGLVATSKPNERDELVRAYHITSKALDVQLFAETASLVIDIAAHLQNRIKNLDLTKDVKRFRHLGRLTRARSRAGRKSIPEVMVTDENRLQSPPLFNAIWSVDLANMQACWVMEPDAVSKSGHEPEDLVFAIRRVNLSTTQENAAKLRIQDMQLQMTPKNADKRKRSLNSALMPEVVFNVAYMRTDDDLRLAFQAAGKSLDIRGTTEAILPASLLKNSIASASQRLREANAIWAASPTQSTKKNALFGNKRLSSLLVDVDFAGATMTVLGRQTEDQQTLAAATAKGSRAEGKYGQYVPGDSSTTASLRAPGVALKVHYGDNGTDDPTLNAELRVTQSSNTLFPTVVPLLRQVSASVKEVVGDQTDTESRPSGPTSPAQDKRDNSLDATNPDTILGRCKLNVGIRICKQEFSLSCQPIARVAATAQFGGIYVTINTVQSPEQRRFFAVTMVFDSLQASVKHVYSNESTASFEVKSIVMSLMNSKHVSTTSGISAILKVSPMKTVVNLRQVQDFLLFREIWVPSNDESPFTQQSVPSVMESSQALTVQRYQQVAATGAFPWNTVISIDELGVQLDLGQALGKADFAIKDLWLSSKKASDWEQNLCAGFSVIGIESTGRLSGSVALRHMRVRTSIQWPPDAPPTSKTPLIQASIGFERLQAQASFDYQPLLVAEVVQFDFLMYNVHGTTEPYKDRLVSILEGDKVQVFITTLTASQSLALYQTWQRLMQDKHAAYEASLREAEQYLRRRSVSPMASSGSGSPALSKPKKDDQPKAPISLHTDVVVTLRAINVGAFPSTFSDNQIFKMEALDAQARFGVYLEENKIRSALGLTLGQLRVALSSINRPDTSEMEELSVDEVTTRATGSRGGTILKVPRVVASMETWQTMTSNEIEYLFRSAFEGKVDVGWNYSRISFIRGMWTNHSRALASRLGKPLRPSAVRITGGPQPRDGDSGDGDGTRPPLSRESSEDKITAVVNVPQSRYVYRPLEPPLIETPQLRDMGEATPPLEWIGLNRDKLPNVTHQIIIVTLLEVAKEVEDAYERILG